MASNASFSQHTGGLEVARNYASQAAGKIALITGVTVDSLGDGIARSFAEGGASLIIITGRNKERLAAATKALSADYPNSTFRPLQFDLTSFQAVRTAAEEILNDASVPQIDYLVACAGTHNFSEERILTGDGLELHLAGNYLAHFLLTAILLPKLRISAKKNPPGGTRIISLASVMILCAPFRFSDYNFDGKALAADEKPNFEPLRGILPFTETEGYEHNIAYGQSKTAAVLFATQISKKLSAEGIYSFSLDPGMVDSQSAHLVWEQLGPEQMKHLETFGILKTVDQGAATVMVAALDPELTPQKGVFLSDCQVKDAPAFTNDPEKAEKLWKLSQELTGAKVEL